jgi:CBS domain-containing protein
MDDVFVGRLMSSPALTARGDETLQRAAERMRSESVGSLVLVDDDGLSGILTQTDFVRAAAAGRDPATTSVEAFATAVVETTTANTAIADAAEMMVAHGVHHLPVVGPDEDVIGVVTATDLTAYLSESER